MTRIERKLWLRLCILGIVLTAGVIVLDYAGGLVGIERPLYDRRARRCQYFTPPPTDKLVHLDIDDPALEAIGAWPWPRSVLAQIFDEARLAGVKVMALDMVFPEPQPPAYQPQGDGGLVEIDHDQIFAQAIARFVASPATAPATPPTTRRAAILPVSLMPKLRAAEPPVMAALREELLGDLELHFGEAAQRIAARGLGRIDQDQFLAARRQVMAQRLDEKLSRGPLSLDEELDKKRSPTPLSLDELRRVLLPKSTASMLISAEARMLEKEYHRHLAGAAMMRFSAPLPPEAPRMLEAESFAASIPQLTSAASQSAFVDYLPFSDGVVRTVPLGMKRRGRLFEQMGLVMACAMLDVDPAAVRISENSVTIPRPAGDIVIPVRARPSGQLGDIGLLMDIPWFGTNNWQTMYDHPAHVASRQHLSINALWSVCDLRRRIVANNAAADEAIKALLDVFDQSALQRFLAKPLDRADAAARLPIIQSVIADTGPFIAEYQKSKPEELKESDKRLIASYQALERIGRQNPRLAAEVDKQRAQLHQQLDGKAVLVGWVALGKTDFVPTSLHGKCPGVVVHGTVFNAIMTNHFWRTEPKWITALITLIMGLCVTAAVARLAPWKALLLALALVGGYLAINGLLLFDYGGRIVGLAGPMLIAGVAWSGLTLVRFIIEAAERARITKRFRSYVDPTLVNYVIEHPEQVRLEGQVRELTVVFTDLAGFTTLNEKLQEQTVPLLNEYMGRMVPLIRKHGGYVNKFLGDGIMFFFGAPMSASDHAARAVAAALDMQKAMLPFNEVLTSRKLPHVAMRVGISTGKMTVGDAGPAERSDYTVLGDAVNLGSRLESANKAVGTHILLSARTAELVKDKFLLRPIGKLRVVGKSEGIMTYEALAPLDEATAAQRRLADLTSAVVDAFMEAQFDDCLAAIARLEEETGSTKLTVLYRSLCSDQQREPSPDFSGLVALFEK